MPAIAPTARNRPEFTFFLRYPTSSDTTAMSALRDYRTRTQVELSFFGAVQSVLELISYGMGAEIEIKRTRPPTEATLSREA